MIALLPSIVLCIASVWVSLRLSDLRTVTGGIVFPLHHCRRTSFTGSVGNCFRNWMLLGMLFANMFGWEKRAILFLSQ